MEDVREGDRMVKKILRFFVLIVFCAVIVFALYKILTAENHFWHTENVEDYNTTEYPIYEPIFLEELPKTAHAVTFCHSDYWYEVKDIFLELKFDTEDDMRKYLTDLKIKCLKDLEDIKPPSNVEWLFEQQNPYDESFTDVFCALYVTATSSESITGYRITLDDQDKMYDCNFGIISYSYEKLTVIQSYIRGNIRESLYDYIPKYFLRFNVPLDENYERVFFVEYSNEKQDD